MRMLSFSDSQRFRSSLRTGSCGNLRPVHIQQTLEIFLTGSWQPRRNSTRAMLLHLLMIVGTRSKIVLRPPLVLVMMVLWLLLLVIIGIVRRRWRCWWMIGQSRRRLRLLWLMERRIEAAPNICATAAATTIRKPLMDVISMMIIIRLVPWISVVGDLVPACRLFTSAAGAWAQRLPRTRHERSTSADHPRRIRRLLTASVH